MSGREMTQWRRAGGVLWRSAPGFLALARPDGVNRVISGPGAALWALLEAPVDLDTVVTTLTDEFGADSGQIRADVTSFLGEMQQLGFVERDVDD